MRVDPDLLAELGNLARQRLVPASFSDQVEAGAGSSSATPPRADAPHRRALGADRPAPSRPTAGCARAAAAAGERRAGLASPEGLRSVEVQAAAVEPSGWRLMIPLVAG